MKKIATILFAAAISSSASIHAQSTTVGGKLDIFDEKGKLLIRTKDDHYNLKTPFQFGLAGVMVNGKLGFINTKGEMVISAAYSASGEIKDGFIALEKSGKVGALNQAGKVVLPFEYKAVSKINQETYWVEQLDGKNVYLDAAGKVTTTPKLSAMEAAQIKYRPLGTAKNHAVERSDRLLQICVGDNRGLIDVSTDTLFHKASGCDAIRIVSLNETYSLLVDTNQYKNLGYGTHLLKNGIEKIAVEGSMGRFSDGYAFYPTEGVVAYQFDKKWGFFNIEGKQLVSPQYDKVTLNLDHPAVSGGGLFMVWKNGLSMVVTRDGAVVPCLGNECKLLPTGDIEFETKNGYGVQNAKGNVLLPVSWGKKNAYKNGFIVGREDKKTSRYNKQWKPIEEIDYKVLKEEGAYLRVEKNNKYGYVNNQGKVVVPIEFDSGIYATGIKPNGLYRDKQNDDLCIGSVEAGVPIYCGYENLEVADIGFSIGQRPPSASVNNAKFDFLAVAKQLRPDGKDEHGFVSAQPLLANDANFHEALKKFSLAAFEVGSKFEAKERMDEHYRDPKYRNREDVEYCKGHCRTHHAKLYSEYIDAFQPFYADFERNKELQKSPHYAKLNATLKTRLDEDSKQAKAVVEVDNKINSRRSFTAQRAEAQAIARAKAEAEARNVAASSGGSNVSSKESDMSRILRGTINAEQKMSEIIQLLNGNFSDKDKREFMTNLRGHLSTWYEFQRLMDIELSNMRNGMSATERASLRALTNKKLADMKAWEERLNKASSGPGFDELVRAFMGIRGQR